MGLERGYDLAFTASNPKSIRLMLPSSPLDARIVVSIFFSNPEQLEVRDMRLREIVPDMHPNTFNFSNRKPTVADPCSTNTYAAWENKLYVVVRQRGSRPNDAQSSQTRVPLPRPTAAPSA